ncbi:MoaD/ThiS family protein [Dietzia aurantiaca]|uniref:MoaD/ThiS family protein n=1 Tax=Dietzia aurantiaca TaxID=983873 RepID=A0ABV9PNZ2_9ACTN
MSSNPRVITVGYYAAAEDAAGTARERLHTHAATVGELAREVCERHGEPLASIVTVSSFLVGEETTRDPHASIAGVSEVDVLPPFAGG